MPTKWRCGICGDSDTSDNPRKALEDHYYSNHHEDAPF